MKAPTLVSFILSLPFNFHYFLFFSISLSSSRKGHQSDHCVDVKSTSELEFAASVTKNRGCPV